MFYQLLIANKNLGENEMKSIRRLNKKNFLIIGTFLIFSIICTYSFNNDGNFKFQNKNFEDIEENNIKFSNLKTSQITGGIYINNNWSAAIGAGFVTGSGIYSDPYIIEDKVIDGNSFGYCIWIENSNEYLKIEN